MDLSIIIINYNCGTLINDCLQSIIDAKMNIKYEIIIVDNNSSDNSKQNVNSSFPATKWIEMGYNAGFARANNVGIRHAKAPVILLLNPDTLVKENAIENCYREFTKDDYIGCGVQLLNLDETPQISGNFAMKGGLNYLLPLPFLGSALKQLGKLFKVKRPNIPDTNITKEVDWINGAFLMVKKLAIDKAGLLDEDFFLYAEEAEWCGRLKKYGRLCIYGQFNIIHLQGSTANKTFDSMSGGYKNLFDRKGLQIMLSNLVRIRKQFGALWYLLILLIYIAEIPIFILGTVIGKIFGKHTYNLKMTINYTSNVWYVFKLSPVILSNKKHFYKVL